MAHLTAGAIEALIRLLADDDPKVVAVAREQLVAAEPARVLQHLSVAVQSADPVVRGRARLLQDEIRTLDMEDQWRTLAAASEVDLEKGAFLVARYRYPDLDEAPYQRQLDDIAAGIAAELTPDLDMYRTIGYLNLHLFGLHGFAGDARTFYDPDNSCLNRVLDRRRGIPITLAVVYMAVAHRLALPVHGVGMPGRFILMYVGVDERVWIDPFQQGALLSRNDCLLRLKETGHERAADRYLEPVSHRQILARMLSNLRRIYGSTQQSVRAAQLGRFIHILSRRQGVPGD